MKQLLFSSFVNHYWHHLDQRLTAKLGQSFVHIRTCINIPTFSLRTDPALVYSEIM
jgi:hypothetical protein